MTAPPRPPGARIRLAVLCGGPSAEHPISLLSSRNILAGASPERFEVVVIGVDRGGRWWLYEGGDHLVHAGDPGRIALGPGGRPVAPVLTGAGGRLRPLDGEGEEVKIDVAFPVMHGPYGEDGTVQAVLEAAHIPYVGSGVTASAVCLDKDHSKAILSTAGIPVVDWVPVRREHIDVARPDHFAAALGALPYFVKPAGLGSSVGISRVDRPEDFEPALVKAFEYDDKVLVEAGIGGRELECAVLGSEAPEASGVGEIVVRHPDGFYSYAAKYLDGDAAELHLDADLDAAVRERVRALSVRAFKVLGCRGLARVDFFLPAGGEPIVNEVNTMPGFTRISMAPRLWERAGLPIERLVERLVELALEG